MTFEYTPKGVCSRKMIIEVENDTVKSLTVIGGCHGNLQGISSLVKGMKVDEVINSSLWRLSNIRRGSNARRRRN